MVLVIRGDGLDAETVLDLKRSSKTAWTNWYPDDLRSFITVEENAGAYDYIFAAGTDVVERIKARLGYAARYLPLACDPSVHRPVQPRSPFRANVVFVGTATPRREAHLKELVEFGLAIWGPGWRRSSLRDYCRGELIPATDFVRAYGGASVAINIHRDADREPAVEETSVNQRVFEIAAIGTPQVVDFRADLRRCFQDGREVLVYRSTAQLRTLVGAALKDLPVAQKLGEAARRKALTRHTYMHRFSAMLRAISRGLSDEPGEDIGSKPIWWNPD
jgi:spore maturation protein CgeB